MQKKIKQEMHCVTLKISKAKYLWLRKALTILSEELVVPLSAAKFLNEAAENAIDKIQKSQLKGFSDIIDHQKENLKNSFSQINRNKQSGERRFGC